MKKIPIFLLAFILAAAPWRPAFAVEGLTISLECNDVILGWPSDPNSGETFIVQHRASLDTNDTWQTLTNFYPASTETNWTTFVHSNVVTCINTNYSGGGTNGGGGPPDPFSFFSSSFESNESKTPVWELEGREPEAWEKENRPAYPWEADALNALHSFQSKSFSLAESESSDPQSASDGGGEIEMGFYRVVRNGVWFFGLTNGTFLSGEVNLPIEAGHDEGALGSVTISANGRPIEGTSMLSEPFSGILSFNVDTRRLLNGDYYLQANGTWQLYSTNEFVNPNVQFYSPTILVTVSNQIMYPDWIQDFRDDLMLIKITSAQTNVDWQIAIYGETGDYVGSFTNHTDDGIIDFSWDLLDSTNNLRTDSSFTTVVTITT